MQWRPFAHQGKNYDLSHLWPQNRVFIQPAKDNKPERRYCVEIEFGLHCFTRGFKDGETPDKALLYSSASETRVFDFERYELSKLLPQIVEQLPADKCSHTGHGNFFCIEVVDNAGNRASYYVFFESSRVAGGGLRLFVQSAYIRADSLKAKPISFFVILFNTQNNRPIKIPT